MNGMGSVMGSVSQWGVVIAVGLAGCGQTADDAAGTGGARANSGGQASGGAEVNAATGGSPTTGGSPATGGSPTTGGICAGLYESLPVETAPQALPAVLEGELCSARDSRVWAVEVVAARPVVVTLENPSAIDHFDLGAYTNLPGYEALAVSAGEARAWLGMTAETALRFTPQETGAVGFYAGLGVTHGEALRLRVEQE